MTECCCNMDSENVKSKKPYTFKAFVYERCSPNTTVGKSIPSPRTGLAIVCDTKNVYSLGCYSPSVLRDNEVRDYDEVSLTRHHLFRQLWKFNFASKKWIKFNSRAMLPAESTSDAVIRQGNSLMIYSSLYTRSDFGNHLYICRLTDESGEICKVNMKGNAPPAQYYGQALVYHDDHLYTIGGCINDSIFSCDIHRFNMTTNIWEAVYICRGQGGYEPEGRARHQVAFDGQNIYVLGGGGITEGSFGFAEIPVFNIEKRHWYLQETYADPRCINSNHTSGIPGERQRHGAVQIESMNMHVFISGGYDESDAYDDLWRLNLKTFQWTLIETCTLSFPTYFDSSAVTPEGRMYIFGGIYEHGDEKYKHVIHSAWLCIPKLSEMCWEALLYYNPQMVNCSKNRLIDASLPRHFVERIE